MIWQLDREPEGRGGCYINAELYRGGGVGWGGWVYGNWASFGGTCGFLALVQVRMDQVGVAVVEWEQ